MTNNKNESDYFYDEFMGSDLECESVRWIMQAIEQKNPRLTLALADTVLFLYKNTNNGLLNLSRLN